MKSKVSKLISNCPSCNNLLVSISIKGEDTTILPLTRIKKLCKSCHFILFESCKGFNEICEIMVLSKESPESPNGKAGSGL